MITRNDVLNKAAVDCLKDLYSKVQPKVDWDDFIQQNKIYSNKYKSWEEYRKLLREKEAEDLSKKELEKFSIFPVSWKDKSINECIGPRPCEFYYLPKEVMKEICDSYVDAYKINDQQNLLDIIEILKGYFREPIVDAWIEEEGSPGHHGYKHPDNLHTEFAKLLECFYDEDIDNGAVAEELMKLVRDFFDKAGEFYNWNRDLNAFNTTVYLGPSPCSDKETVIKNWKQYRDKTILIDDSIYLEEED